MKGRLFKQADGKNLAAIKIQCTWRRYRDRTAYLQYRKRRWAAGVIALTWLTYVKLSKARESLKITRQRQLENFRFRQKVIQISIFLVHLIFNSFKLIKIFRSL